MGAYLPQPSNYVSTQYTPHISPPRFKLSVHSVLQLQSSENIEPVTGIESYISLFYLPVYGKSTDRIMLNARGPPLYELEGGHHA